MSLRKKFFAGEIGGMCFYCGDEFYDFESDSYYLEWATLDHVVPRSKGGSDEKSNIVLACRSCNASKGTKSLDEFRFWCGMEVFKAEHGVKFTPEQYAFLLSKGFDIGFKTHEFAEEKQSREIREACIEMLKPENLAITRTKREANQIIYDQEKANKAARAKEVSP